MLDAIFRLFFNYRPVVFQQGEFRLLPTTGSYVAAAVVVAAIVITFLTYRAARARSDARHRAVLAAIRSPCSRSSSSACSARCSWSRRRCRSRTSSASWSTTRAACRSPTSNGGPRARFVAAAVRRPGGGDDAGARQPLRPSHFRFSSTASAPRRAVRPDVQRRPDPHRQRRSTAPGRSSPGCRSPASSSSATAPTPPTPS